MSHVSFDKLPVLWYQIYGRLPSTVYHSTDIYLGMTSKIVFPKLGGIIDDLLGNVLRVAILHMDLYNYQQNGAARLRNVRRGFLERVCKIRDRWESSPKGDRWRLDLEKSELLLRAFGMIVNTYDHNVVTDQLIPEMRRNKLPMMGILICQSEEAVAKFRLLIQQDMFVIKMICLLYI
jgi:hypothetical protein